MHLIRNLLRAALALSVALAASLPERCAAQSSTSVDPIRGAGAALARYRTEVLEGAPGRTGGMQTVMRIATESRSEAAVDSVLDGLEQMACESEHPLGPSAAGLLAGVGERQPSRSPDVVPRLVRIYEQTRVPVVRLVVINGVARQPVGDGTLRFLANVAQGIPPRLPGSELEPFYAVSALNRMGARGRERLRELHRTGSVHDSQARGYIDHVLNERVP